MSTFNLSSENIRVFPFSKTRESDRYSRVLNEQTIVKFIKSIVDNDSYVLRVHKDGDDIKIVEFVLNGYYFYADFSTLWENNADAKNWNCIYATICVNKDDNAVEYLDGGDNTTGANKLFTGVSFTSDVTTVSGYTHSLLLLQKDEEKGVFEVPAESYLKFDLKSIDSSKISVDLSNYVTNEALATKLTEYKTNTLDPDLTEKLDPYVKFENNTINSIDVINCGSATVLID